MNQSQIAAYEQSIRDRELAKLGIAASTPAEVSEAKEVPAEQQPQTVTPRASIPISGQETVTGAFMGGNNPNEKVRGWSQKATQAHAAREAARIAAEEAIQREVQEAKEAANPFNLLADMKALKADAAAKERTIKRLEKKLDQVLEKLIDG